MDNYSMSITKARSQEMTPTSGMIQSDALVNSIVILNGHQSSKKDSRFLATKNSSKCLRCQLQLGVAKLLLKPDGYCLRGLTR